MKLWKTPEYRSWDHIRARCTNPKHDSYKYYGGRGVKICERWKSFSCFLEDVGPRPSLRHSIERIDTNGDYCPGNCKWATAKEQANNRRNNVWITIRGESKTVAQWADHFGLLPNSIYTRLFRGIDGETAVVGLIATQRGPR